MVLYHVTSITLQFVLQRLPVAFGDLVRYDWKGFDRAAASLPALDAVILALPCLDDVQRFAEEIAPTMVHLHIRNALRYAVWAEDEEWKWIWIATMPEATAAGESL